MPSKSTLCGVIQQSLVLRAKRENATNLESWRNIHAFNAKFLDQLFYEYNKSRTQNRLVYQAQNFKIQRLLFTLFRRRFGELSRPTTQHLHSLLHGPVSLITDGDHTFSQELVVLPKQVHSNENVIDISEDQSIFLSIEVLLLKESDRVISPVTTRVQVVRSVVAVIERESVTLIFVSLSSYMLKQAGKNSPGHQ